MLSGGQLAVALALGALAASGGLMRPPGLAVILAALVFAVVGSLQVHIELRRHACAVTVVEAVLIVALIHLSPSEVILAAVLGEGLACLKQGQPLQRLGFNVTGAMLASSVAALSFVALPASGTADPVTWLSALLAVGCYAVVGQASTAAVLAVVERRRFEQVFLSSLAPAGIAAAVSATVGLVGVVLLSVSAAALVLALPLVALAMAETRRVAEHRGDHLRFKRLYAASARTVGLTSETEAMATLANEARTLVTGAVAVICTSDGDLGWYGVTVDDRGPRPASVAEVEAVIDLAGRGSAEVGIESAPQGLATLEPGLASLVVASALPGAAAPVSLAVLRNLPSDVAAGTRAEVLSAFIGHAALTIANARLYAEVEDALAHQLDLNRQKDDFVATMSHELRTPLTAMIGAMSTIRRVGERLDQDQRDDLLELGLRQGGRLKQLIEDLLLLSQVEASAGEEAASWVDLAALVSEIADDLAARPGLLLAPIELQPGPIPPLCTDTRRLRQVLTNLIENGCKYAPGSPIEVAALAALDGAVSISVTDHGPGIRDQDRERVFERFVQLDGSATRSQGGSGLGLYICRQLLTALGGSLQLSDVPGGGACFTITLPTMRAEVSVIADPPARRDLVGATSPGGSQ